MPIASSYWYIQPMYLMAITEKLSKAILSKIN